MKKLLKFIVSNLASKPKKVKVQEREEEGVTIFDVTLDDEDKGKIIGKMGRNIKAIRQILSIIARKDGTRVLINIL